jgi:acetyl esterase/lipase
MKYDLCVNYEVLERDVAYRDVDGHVLLSHVYEPQGEGPFPMLIDLHGGGWNRYDRLRNRPVDLELAQHGLVVASLDFRLKGQAEHPAAMQDINYGIRWFKAHAADFNATAQGMGGLGFSSGGHQILLAGLRPHHPAYLTSMDALPVDATLDYVICSGCGYDLLSSVCDPSPSHANAVDAFDLVNYFGGIAGVKNESPIHVLQSAENLHHPALLLIQAGGDVLPGFTNARAGEFVQAYSAAGGQVEMMVLPHAPHIFINPGLVKPSENMQRGLLALKSYIARQLDYLSHPFIG